MRLVNSTPSVSRSSAGTLPPPASVASPYMVRVTSTVDVPRNSPSFFCRPKLARASCIPDWVVAPEMAFGSVSAFLGVAVAGAEGGGDVVDQVEAQQRIKIGVWRFGAGSRQVFLPGSRTGDRKLMARPIREDCARQGCLTVDRLVLVPLELTDSCTTRWLSVGRNVKVPIMKPGTPSGSATGATGRPSTAFGAGILARQAATKSASACSTLLNGVGVEPVISPDCAGVAAAVEPNTPTYIPAALRRRCGLRAGRRRASTCRRDRRLWRGRCRCST
jgi:hypothetical protein